MALKFKPLNINTEPWKPTETIEITENGTYDVTDCVSAEVSVGADIFNTLKQILEGGQNNNDRLLVEIPYGVTKIRDAAFHTNNFWNYFSDFVIPTSITIIGDRVFDYNTSVQGVPFSLFYSGNLEQWMNIEKGTTNPNDVNDPTRFNGITLSHNQSYKLYLNNDRSEYIRDIIIPNTITTLKKGALCNISVSSIFIPNSVKEIGIGAFLGVRTSELTFEDGCEMETLNGFQYLKLLKDISLPKCKVIGRAAFYWAESLTNINFQEGLEVLSQESFYSCRNVKAFHLPQSLKQIGASAFYWCTPSYINIPKNVENIGSNAFYLYSSANCIVDVESEIPCTVHSSVQFYRVIKIYVPKGASEVYKSATNWSKFASKIYEKITLNVMFPPQLIGNETISYSIDGGKTYQQFTSDALTLNEVAVINIKSTDSTQTIAVGTTSGGSDLGTISNNEITLSFNTDTTIYLTL